ncbi:MAG: FecR domain-containing protein [Verrucomicrobia subdivision 3 bacterium]|nr:FecR domain-containing protein [Limisphaerales bacterium]
MVSIVLVASANAQTTKERTGKVVRIKGAARYSTGNKTWQPLKVGTILKSGSVIQTAADSYADIVINEEATADAVIMPRPSTQPSSASASGGGAGGGAGAKSPEYDVVRVQDDTVLAIDKLSATDTGADRVTETELDLRTGSIFGSVKKQAAASRFEVKIPNGVAGIRGTIFSINANGLISCLTGSVVSAFTDDSNKVTTRVVPAGFQFNSRNGQMGAMGSALLGQLQGIASDISYNFSGGRRPDFNNYMNLGREWVSPTQP